MSGLAAFLWLGPSVQKCRLGRHWKLISRVVADAANFLGHEAPQYSQAEDETLSYSGLVEAHKAVPSELVLIRWGRHIKFKTLSAPDSP